jgi:hypothetical protein
MHDARFYPYLKFNWMSDDPKTIACSQMLCSERTATSNPVRKRGLDLSDAFNVILTSLEVCMGYNPNTSIHIAKDKNIYTGKYRRSPSYTREVLSALDFLIAEEYLLLVSGITKTKDKDGRPQWRPARYRLSEKWRSVIGDKPLSDTELIRRNPLNAYVDLRHKVDGKSKSLNISYEIYAYNKELIESTTTLLSQYDELLDVNYLDRSASIILAGGSGE